MDQQNFIKWEQIIILAYVSNSNLTINFKICYVIDYSSSVIDYTSSTKLKHMQ